MLDVDETLKQHKKKFTMETKYVLYGLIMLSVSILLAAFVVSFAISQKLPACKYDVVANEDGLIILLNKETGELTRMAGASNGGFECMKDRLKRLKGAERAPVPAQTIKYIPVDYDPFATSAPAKAN